MSELKVYHCNEWHNEYTEFYLKSEADKVIAELKAQKAQVEDDCANWKACEGQAVNVMLEAKKECISLTKSERHHKYKRCLDMARWCKLWYETEKYEWHLKDVHHWFRMSLYDKWYKRWLELAEKFKEEK